MANHVFTYVSTVRTEPWTSKLGDICNKPGDIIPFLSDQKFKMIKTASTRPRHSKMGLLAKELYL